jgi:hypothetical protein
VPSGSKDPLAPRRLLVREDVEVITGITERFVSQLVRVSVARYAGCLTNAGL